MPVKSLRVNRSIISSLTAATLIAVPIVIAIAGCRTVPVTGRKQVSMPWQSEAKEIEMGEAAYTEILAEESLSTNAEATAMVERVGRRIAAVSGRDDYQWEFKLIAGPTKNAFCLPGGKVAIYEGILPVCGNEAGLAVVMSHEIAHAIARHGGERMQHQTMAAVGKTLGGAAIKKVMGNKGEMDQQTLDRAAIAYGAVTKYGVILPYSRKHESEADAIGIRMMAKAGYDPSEAPHFWDRFAQVSGPKPPAFFSTHPSDARRATDLREQLPANVAIYNAAVEQHGLGEAIPEIQLASHEETNSGQTIEPAVSAE